MKIAVIGNGVVGRALARSIAKSCQVDLYHVPGRAQSQLITKLEQRKAIQGAQQAFPAFDCDGGSMGVWGGMLAVPSDSFLQCFNIALSAHELTLLISEHFTLEFLFGKEFGALTYLFKAQPTVLLSDTITQIGTRVDKILHTEQGPVLFDSQGHPLGVYDACFIATGASSIPHAIDGGVELRRPRIIFDKVITIEPRDGYSLSQYREEDGITCLSVPICIPTDYRRATIEAVFHHILSGTGLMSATSVVSGYLAHAADFAGIVTKKLRNINQKLWFSTYCGADRHPLCYQNSELGMDAELIQRFGGEVFMPALHSDARLDAEISLGPRIYSEHLSAALPPIPFNPVVVRLAKLYADFQTFSRYPTTCRP